MTNTRRINRAIAVSAVGALAVLVGRGWAEDGPLPHQGSPADQPAGSVRVVGMTSPSRTAVLAAVLPARIATLTAAEGSTVKAGDVVVTLEDGVQRTKTEMARAAAESTLEVEQARVRSDLARRQLDRMIALYGRDDSSSKELHDAQAACDLARLDHELARFNHAQARRQYERERGLLEEYTLRAPFDGYVVEHLKRAGEAIDQLEGMVRLAALDPLLVVLDCPLAPAPQVFVGQRVTVEPTDGPWEARLGTVVLVSRVADAASQTVKVKVEVPNEDAGWPAGLKTEVDFTPGAAAESRPAESHRPDDAASLAGQKETAARPR